MVFWPSVREKDERNIERISDIPSKLLDNRVILLYGPIDDNMAASISSQLLFLAQEDPESDITMYINSPGGSVTSGFTIYDTMQFIKPDVKTIGMGMSASMAAFLLCSGAKGKRFVLPNSEVMIHQPLGGAQGQATDIEIVAKNISRIKKNLYEIMAKNTGKEYQEIYDACERDNYLSAEEAVEFGLVDRILTPGGSLE
jgi:ATP-dependent Clp protease protease subunit